MIPSRYRVFCIAGPLVALGLVLIPLLSPQNPQRHIAVGYLFGTMFAQATLASAWCALGPAPIGLRLTLSLIWVSIISIPFAIYLGIHGGPAVRTAVVLWICLLGQWLLVQIALWGLKIVYGVSLRHPDDAEQGTNLRERQFGIRQLMLVTAIVGVTFGIGQIITNIATPFHLTSQDAAIGFLVVAACILTLPLLLASLLPRFSLAAILLALVLIVLATAWEYPLLRRVGSGGLRSHNLVWINFFTSAWILAVAVVVRHSGYRLALTGSRPPTDNTR